MRFCEAEYSAPSVVSHHENPASEPSVFWSAGCPSFGPMLRIALCTFGKRERRIGRGKPTHQSEREECDPAPESQNPLNVGSTVAYPKYPSSSLGSRPQ